MPFDEVQQGEYDCLSAASLIFALERVVNGMHSNDPSGKREAKGELLYVTTRAMNYIGSVPTHSFTSFMLSLNVS